VCREEKLKAYCGSQREKVWMTEHHPMMKKKCIVREALKDRKSAQNSILTGKLP